MKYKRKNVILYRNQILNSKWVWILAVLSLYGIFAYYFESLRFSAFDCMSASDIKSINDITMALSCSYWAGMMVYILTDFIPTTKKMQSVLANASEDLRFVENDYKELWNSLAEHSDFNDKSFTKDVFKKLTGIEYDSVTISAENVNILKMHIERYDKILSDVMLHYGSYLSSNDYIRLFEVRNSFAYQQIKMHMERSQSSSYTKEACMKLVEDLISTNKIVINLHKNLNDFVPDKNEIIK